MIARAGARSGRRVRPIQARLPIVEYQVIDGASIMMRPWTHPDFWGVNAAGSGGAGLPLPTLSDTQKNDIVRMVHDPATGCGVNVMRTVEPSRSLTGRNYQLEPTLSDADPTVYTPAGFNFNPSDSAGSDGVAAHVDYVSRARQYGVKTWSSFLHSETWMTGKTSATPTANDVGYYSRNLWAWLKAFADAGEPFDYWSVANEPSYSRNTLSKEFHLAALKNVAARLAASGLAPQCVTPDDVRSTNARDLIDAVMADPAAAASVGFFATHLYDEGVENYGKVQSRGNMHNRRHWMTEVFPDSIGGYSGALGQAALHLHLLVNYNASLVAGMTGAWGQQEPNSVVEVAYSGGAVTGITFRKLGHYMAQLFRHVRPGDRRIDAASSNANVVVAAFRGPAGSGTEAKRVVVALNPTGGSLSPTITATGLQGVTTLGTVRRTAGETLATENYATLGSQAVSGMAITPTLPAASLVTFEGTAA